MSYKNAPKTNDGKKTKKEPRYFFDTEKELAMRDYRRLGIGYTKVAQMFETERM